MDSDDDLLVKKAEEKDKNTKKQKLEEADLSELLAGIRTMLKKDNNI